MPFAFDPVSYEDWESTFLDQLLDDASYAAMFEEWIDAQDEGPKAVASTTTIPPDIFQEVQDLVPTYKQDSDTESDSCSEFSDVRFITPTPPVQPPPPRQSSSSTSLTGKRKRDESEDSDSELCPRKSNKIPRRDKKPSSTPLALTLAPEIPEDILNGGRREITTEELKMLVDASELVEGVPPKKSYWPTRKRCASGSKQRRLTSAVFACIFCDSDFTRAAGMRNHYRGKTSHNFTTTDQDHYICELGCKLRSGEVFYTYNKRDLTRHVEESRKHQDRMRELGLVAQTIADAGDSHHSCL